MAWVSAAAVGVSAVQNRRGRKSGDAAAGDAAANTQKGVDAMEQGISYLDGLQPAIDNFAQQGQQQFDKYQRMMGPVEESVGDYYMNLNPDDYAAQGNQVAQQQNQQAMKQVNDQLAVQGIANMGANTQLDMQNTINMGQTKAQNIFDAPQQVAEQQQKWLGYTSGQQNNAFNQMNQGVNMQAQQANSYNNAYNNMANMYGGQAQQSNQAAQSSYAQGNQALQSGMMLGGYMYNRNNKPGA